MNSSTIDDWLDSLAAKQPTPGGGAVAALAAAMSAAQLNMVTAYTTGPKWQDREQRMKDLSRSLSDLRVQALEIAKQDAEAFAKLSAAYKIPDSGDSQKSQRGSAIQQALTEAAVPPTKTAQLAGKLVAIAEELVEAGNPNVVSDVAVGASLARAALESAIVNIEINAKDIRDSQVKSSLKQEVEDAVDFIQDVDVIVESVRDKLGSK